MMMELCTPLSYTHTSSKSPLGIANDAGEVLAPIDLINISSLVCPQSSVTRQHGTAQPVLGRTGQRGEQVV